LDHTRRAAGLLQAGAAYRVFYVVHDPTATVHVIDIVHTARETRLAEYRDTPG